MIRAHRPRRGALRLLTLGQDYRRWSTVIRSVQPHGRKRNGFVWLRRLGYSNPAGYQTAAQVTATFGAPPAIGNTTPASGAFTTLAASGVTALSSGVSFGSPVVTGVDLSKHIALFGTNIGINYVSPNLNFVVIGTTQATLSTAAMVLTGNLRINGNVGFFNSSAAAKATVSGAKGEQRCAGFVDRCAGELRTDHRHHDGLGRARPFSISRLPRPPAPSSPCRME